MNRRYVILSLLSVFWLVASFVAHVYDSAWIESLTGNLAAGFIGSLMTVWLIETSIEKHRQSELERVRRVFWRQLSGALRSHIGFLWMLHRAAAASRPEAPKSIEEFLTQGYFSDFDRFNFSRQAPAIPKQTWQQFAGNHMREWRDSAQVLIDRYGTFLDAEAIEEVESAVSTTAVGLMSRFDVTHKMMGGDLSAVIGAAALINDHALRISRVCALFNRWHERPILVSNCLPGWDRDDFGGGAYGNARMTDEEWKQTEEHRARVNNPSSN